MATKHVAYGFPRPLWELPTERGLTRKGGWHPVVEGGWKKRAVNAPVKKRGATCWPVSPGGRDPGGIPSGQRGFPASPATYGRLPRSGTLT